MRGTDHNHKKGNIFQNTIAHIYYYINIVCLPLQLWYQNSLFCLAILHDTFATEQCCSFPAKSPRWWLDFPLGAGEREWLNINFSNKENIFRLENFWKSCTNKNISSFLHLDFGIWPQILVGWEYFRTYLSLKSMGIFKNLSYFGNQNSRVIEGRKFLKASSLCSEVIY